MTATKVPTVQASVRLRLLRPDDVEDVIRRRSLSLHTRMRVSEAIREVAIDVCGGEESLSAVDRAWLRQHISSAVNEATEEALRVLADELTSALRTAPRGIRPAFVSPRISRTDFE